MNDVELESFWGFCLERDAIRVRRASGLPTPWTDDLVLRDCHFTNIHRAHDTGTQWLLETGLSMAPALRTRLDILFRVTVYRQLNRVPTFKALGFPACTPEGIEAWWLSLHELRLSGAALGSHRHCTEFSSLRANLPAWCEPGAMDMAREVWACADGIDASAAVRRVRRIGPFFSLQIVADLATLPTSALGGLAPPTFGPDTLVPLGPGSRQASRVLLGELDPSVAFAEGVKSAGSSAAGARRDAEAILPLLVADQPVGFAEPVTAIDVEHALCEWSKYRRVQLGGSKGKLKRTHPLKTDATAVKAAEV